MLTVAWHGVCYSLTTMKTPATTRSWEDSLAYSWGRKDARKDASRARVKALVESGPNTHSQVSRSYDEAYYAGYASVVRK